MLKLKMKLLVQSNPRRIHAHLSQIRGFSRRILQTPPQTRPHKPRASDFFLRSRAYQVSSYSAMSPETRDAGSRDIPGDGWSAGTGGIFTFARSQLCAQFSPRRRGRVRGGAVLAVLLSAGGANAASVSVGKTHACAVLNDGKLMCWGYNDMGQLGIGVFGGTAIHRSGR